MEGGGQSQGGGGGGRRSKEQVKVTTGCYPKIWCCSKTLVGGEGALMFPMDSGDAD